MPETTDLQRYTVALHHIAAIAMIIIDGLCAHQVLLPQTLRCTMRFSSWHALQRAVGHIYARSLPSGSSATSVTGARG